MLLKTIVDVFDDCVTLLNVALQDFPAGKPV
jgi:hypothetical protein